MNKLLKKSPKTTKVPNEESRERTLPEVNKLRDLHSHGSFTCTSPASPCSVIASPRSVSVTGSMKKTFSNPGTPRLSNKHESWGHWRTKQKATSSTDSVFTHSPQHKDNR